MYKTRRKYWDKLPTSTGDRRISEPSTVRNPIELVSCKRLIGKRQFFGAEQYVIFAKVS